MGMHVFGCKRKRERVKERMRKKGRDKEREREILKDLGIQLCGMANMHPPLSVLVDLKIIISLCIAGHTNNKKTKKTGTQIKTSQSRQNVAKFLMS